MSDLAAADPDAPARLVVRRQPGRKVLVRVSDVAGFGWKRIDATAEGAALVGAAIAPVTAEATTLDNGLVRIDVDPQDGTFAVDGLAGFGRLIDDGDEGDTYNYCPPADDQVVDTPTAVEVTVVESGPLRAALRLRSTYTWPERIATGARVGRRDVEVVTRLELRAGERLVRVTTELDNPSRDHRLRVRLPLPEPATASEAECAFTVVTRGLDAEGGPIEAPMPTYPSRRFVRAGG